MNTVLRKLFSSFTILNRIEKIGRWGKKKLSITRVRCGRVAVAVWVDGNLVGGVDSAFVLNASHACTKILIKLIDFAEAENHQWKRVFFRSLIELRRVKNIHVTRTWTLENEKQIEFNSSIKHILWYNVHIV